MNKRTELIVKREGRRLKYEVYKFYPYNMLLLSFVSLPSEEFFFNNFKLKNLKQ